MKKNKLGIMIATAAITLIAIGVLADYLYSTRIPEYEHGKIVAVTMLMDYDGLYKGEPPYNKYYAYKGSDGYVFAYEDGVGERQEFGLSKNDFNKLIRYDYDSFMRSDYEDPYSYTIFEFEDGTTQKIPNCDCRARDFFYACERTFIYHEDIIWG